VCEIVVYEVDLITVGIAIAKLRQPNIRYPNLDYCWMESANDNTESERIEQTHAATHVSSAILIRQK